MANPSKQKGTRYESDLVRAFNAWAGGDVCERVVLHGSRDWGDLSLRVDDLVVCVESKWRKSYPSDKDMLSFREQTLAETRNSDADCGAYVVNHYRQSVWRSEVWMPGRTWLLVNGYDALAERRGHSERDWCCMTLADFCETCFGDPPDGLTE